MFDRPQQEQEKLALGGPTPSAGLANLCASALLTLFPARCGACRSSMAHRSPTTLCARCLPTLQANDGPRCPRCDQPGSDLACHVCRARPRAFAALRAPWQYGGAVAELVVASKFHAREDLAKGLAALIAADPRAMQLACEARFLVPVPLGGARRRERGYNPSTALAHSLGRMWSMPVQHALQRQRDTLPQSALKLAERRINVREAFAPRSAVTGTAMLIDDVVTSGETVHDAARALLAAGATRVVVVAAARSVA